PDADHGHAVLDAAEEITVEEVGHDSGYHAGIASFKPRGAQRSGDDGSACRSPAARLVARGAGVAASARVPALARPAIQLAGLAAIARHAPTFLGHATEVVARGGLPRDALLVVALGVLPVVLPADAASLPIHRTQVGAALRAAAVTGLAEELDGPAIVPPHALPALHVDAPEAGAARGVARVAAGRAAPHVARGTRREAARRGGRQHDPRQQQPAMAFPRGWSHRPLDMPTTRPPRGHDSIVS